MYRLKSTEIFGKTKNNENTLHNQRYWLNKWYKVQIFILTKILNMLEL